MNVIRMIRNASEKNAETRQSKSPLTWRPNDVTHAHVSKYRTKKNRTRACKLQYQNDSVICEVSKKKWQKVNKFKTDKKSEKTKNSIKVD